MADAVVGTEYSGVTLVVPVVVVAGPASVRLAVEEAEKVEDPRLTVVVGSVVANEAEVVDK